MIDNILDNSRIGTWLNEYSPVVNDSNTGRSIYYTIITQSYLKERDQLLSWRILSL